MWMFEDGNGVNEWHVACAIVFKGEIPGHISKWLLVPLTW